MIGSESVGMSELASKQFCVASFGLGSIFLCSQLHIVDGHVEHDSFPDSGQLLLRLCGASCREASLLHLAVLDNSVCEALVLMTLNLQVRQGLLNSMSRLCFTRGSFWLLALTLRAWLPCECLFVLDQKVLSFLRYRLL